MKTMPRRRSTAALAIAAVAVGALAIAPAAAPAARATIRAASLSGSVTAAARPLASSRVTLFAAGRSRSVPLAAATTRRDGRFRISYSLPRGDAVLYVVASGGRSRAGSALRLASVAGTVAAPIRRVRVNELTTVAVAYALNRFVHGARISGPSPGLGNAAATVANLITPATGGLSPVIARSPNGNATDTLATFRTLASILAGCTGGTARDCGRLLSTAAPPRGPRPPDTLAAAWAIARNPVHDARAIFRLRRSPVYGPGLRSAPTAWVLSLKYTGGGFDGPGRMAFDSRGRVFVTNNFQPPGTTPGEGLIALSPTGRPILGSPITGGGIAGLWWGIAIDRRDRVWMGNFTDHDPLGPFEPGFVGGKSVSMVGPDGRPRSPSTGFEQGPISAAQGIAVDPRGNVWIANHGNDTVTEYPHGDPRKARVVSGGGIAKPFGVASDGRGNVWVTDNALSAGVGGITRIDSSGRAHGPITGGGLASPQGIALDSRGNVWVANFRGANVTEIGPDGRIKARSPISLPSFTGPWGIAVDGNDNVWVASFLSRTITELCGERRAECPPGAKTGQPISPQPGGFTNGGLEHLTAIQVDQSGNVWTANNWVSLSPVVGGDGLVELLGAAAPVRMPLIGLPRRP